MTTFAEESLRKALRVRSELEAAGREIPYHLQTDYLVEKYQLPSHEIEERLRPYRREHE